MYVHTANVSCLLRALGPADKLMKLFPGTASRLPPSPLTTAFFGYCVALVRTSRDANYILLSDAADSGGRAVYGRSSAEIVVRIPPVACQVAVSATS